MSRARIKVSGGVAAGDLVTVKVLIRHPMESGHRRDRVGARIPRNIIHRFTAHYDGAEVFRMELFPGMAADPFLEFKTVATVSGEITCRWEDDAGGRFSQSVPITVR